MLSVQEFFPKIAVSFNLLGMNHDFLLGEMDESLNKLTEVMNEFQLAIYKLSVQTLEIEGEVNPLMN